MVSWAHAMFPGELAHHLPRFGTCVKLGTVGESVQSEGGLYTWKGKEGTVRVVGVCKPERNEGGGAGSCWRPGTKDGLVQIG